MSTGQFSNCSTTRRQSFVSSVSFSKFSGTDESKVAKSDRAFTRRTNGLEVAVLLARLVVEIDQTSRRARVRGANDVAHVARADGAADARELLPERLRVDERMSEGFGFFAGAFSRTSSRGSRLGSFLLNGHINGRLRADRGMRQP
jgi:hypothetical protein